MHVLQTTTGKLFTRTTGREDTLRRIRFTKLRLGSMPPKVLEGALFGRLVQASELNAIPDMLVGAC